MANRYRNLIYSTAEYTHSYGGFKGVELNAGSLISSTARLAYSQNMYKDYDGDGADVLESIPGFRCFAKYDNTVNALYYQRSQNGRDDHVLVHVGNKLMRHPVSDIHRTSTTGVEIATLQNYKSFGFEYGRFFYVMDSQSILRIDEDGGCTRVGEAEAYPYVPTTYVSGEVYEQRNLLTDDFKEEFYVADPCVYLYATDGLKFTVTDSYLKYCAVSGISSEISGEVYLPAYVNIAGAEYKVQAVGEYAFADNTKITSVYISEGIAEIGRYAFAGCTALTGVITPSSLKVICSRAFYNCSKLSTLYLGAGVTKIESGAFISAKSLQSVNYALSEYELSRIDGRDEIEANTFIYNSTYDAVSISLPLHEKVEAVKKVIVNGEECAYGEIKEGDVITGVRITFVSLSDATDAKVTVEGVLSPLEDGWACDMTSYSEASPYEAIVKCTTAEVFDGRIFFSGNPNFPNTVFYTERQMPNRDGALYVGRYNYFNDGVGSYRVKAMLAVRDMLAVFKEGDDGSGSIFYHKKEATALNTIDTVYPVAYVHSGVSCVGSCLSFLDDPVFLTTEGLMALNGENINYQRNVVCRSHNVNYALLKEDLSKVSLCEWLGYLVIGINGKILLADSRSTFLHPAGSREYEWFMLTDIGAYHSDFTVYKYSYDPHPNAEVHPTLSGQKVNYLNVRSASDSQGNFYHYVIEDGKHYRVFPTEERDNGVFSPATVFISHGKLLMFATESGHVCVFNNDMRGIAPDEVRNTEDFDEDEYRAVMGNKIHPVYYSFDHHAPTYVIKTALDNCGVPHLTKSTVKKSLVIKAKSSTPDAIRCEVTTDANEPVLVGSFPSSEVGFDDFDFNNSPWYVSRYRSVALSEKEKRWIEKQITLTSKSFQSPISIYSISYRYVIKGKIKNNS